MAGDKTYQGSEQLRFVSASLNRDYKALADLCATSTGSDTMGAAKRALQNALRDEDAARAFFVYSLRSKAVLEGTLSEAERVWLASEGLAANGNDEDRRKREILSQGHLLEVLVQSALESGLSQLTALDMHLLGILAARPTQDDWVRGFLSNEARPEGKDLQVLADTIAQILKATANAKAWRRQNETEGPVLSCAHPWGSRGGGATIIDRDYEVSRNEILASWALEAMRTCDMYDPVLLVPTLQCLRASTMKEMGLADDRGLPPFSETIMANPRHCAYLTSESYGEEVWHGFFLRNAAADVLIAYGPGIYPALYNELIALDESIAGLKAQRSDTKLDEAQDLEWARNWNLATIASIRPDIPFVPGQAVSLLPRPEVK
jgi:hypothetical protein